MTVRKYAPGQAFQIALDRPQTLEVPVDTMSIAFLIGSRSSVELEYPKYVLRSDDGDYDQERSARHDLIPGDAYLELKFERLISGKRYTLTRFDDAEISEMVFDNLPFAEIVDQPRAMHETLQDHAYGELLLGGDAGPFVADAGDDTGSGIT